MAGKQRKSLVKGVAKGEQNTQRLNSAHQMASNTADVGDEILKSLHNQREKIVSARVAAIGVSPDSLLRPRVILFAPCGPPRQK